jgi:hypothetical protein
MSSRQEIRLESLRALRISVKRMAIAALQLEAERAETGNRRRYSGAKKLG